MKAIKNFIKPILLTAIVAAAPLAASASFSDSFQIPGPDATARAGALMPYTRYDSNAATLGGGAKIESSTNIDVKNIASQASDRSYISLPSSGAYAEWTVAGEADGVTMRFTMPDSSDGMGQNGSLDVYVNGVKDQTVNLTSYYMYQYFNFYSGTPSDTPNGNIPGFAFDEVHFRLNKALKAGDKIKIASSGANGLVYGVDFIEIEKIPEPIGRPAGSLSVADFGAKANDGADDMNAFNAAMSAAAAQGKTLYIPEGTFELSQMWHVYGNGVKLTGAGIWYTNIKFTNPNQAGGGISGGSGASVCDCVNMEICHMYINSSLRSRYNENAIYKCFMDVFSGGTVIHDIWEDHFECGFWIADYNGSMEYSDGLKIINCRIRNNLADGVNFCQGTSNAAVYNCSIRNCGDDGLAMWNNDYAGAKDESNNIFAYNTIDFIWRAGGIAIYGGDGHSIHNNYIRDMFMASGIHLNTTFPGYAFRNTNSMTFANNILVGTGTEADCWKEDLAGIDLKQSVRNVTFDNTQIYDSPAYAMRLFSGPENIRFNNTTILGAGLAGSIIEYSCVQHSACAIRLQNDNISFTGGVTIGGVAPDARGNNSTWPVWTDNNQQLASKVGYTYTNKSYTVPGYPTADTIQTGGINNGPEPEPEPVEVKTVAFNGSINDGEWSGDIAMTERDGIWHLDNVRVKGANAEFGIRVTTTDGVATWYMCPQGTPRIEATTTLTLVREGTPGAFNTFIADGTWSFAFDPETHSLTATLVAAGNQYAHWYIGLGCGWNGWEEESFEVHPDENGIAEFPAMVNLGEWFRIRMWDNSIRKAYTLFGPEVSSTGEWYESERYDDLGDGAFHIVNPVMFNNVVVVVDVPNNRVCLHAAAADCITNLDIRYDNSESRWAKVMAHIWDPTDNATADIELTPCAGSDTMWESTASLGFTPKMILFYCGEWGEGKQTRDLEFSNYTTYDFHGNTGVEAVEADSDTPAEYYDMRGIRVDNPTSTGIYIVRRGLNVSKVVIR